MEDLFGALVSQIKSDDCGGHCVEHRLSLFRIPPDVEGTPVKMSTCPAFVMALPSMNETSVDTESIVMFPTEATASPETPEGTELHEETSPPETDNGTTLTATRSATSAVVHQMESSWCLLALLGLVAWNMWSNV